MYIKPMPVHIVYQLGIAISKHNKMDRPNEIESNLVATVKYITFVDSH